MLRVTEIKLPLTSASEKGHTDAEIRAAIIKKLAINAADLLEFAIFKRGVDARKASAILLVYSLDVKVNGEAKVLAKLSRDPHVKPAPDTSYKFVTHTPSPQPSPTRGEGVWFDKLTTNGFSPQPPLPQGERELDKRRTLQKMARPPILASPCKGKLSN